MKTKHAFGILASVAVLMSGAVCRAGGVYYNLDGTPAALDNNVPGHDNGAFWTAFPASPGLGGLLKNQVVWIGLDDPLEKNDWKKSVTIVLSGLNLNQWLPLSAFPGAATDAQNDIKAYNGPQQVPIGFPLGPGNFTKAQINFTMAQQPPGEWVKLTVAGNTLTPIINSIDAWQQCINTKNNGRQTDIKSTLKGDGPALTTKLWIFPDVSIDMTATPTLDAPAGSGNWSYQYVTTDPYGNSMPLGGVEWTTDGAGINDGDTVSASTTQLSPDGLDFTLYSYDANANQIVMGIGTCPEPSTSALVALGAGALLALRKRRT